MRNSRVGATSGLARLHGQQLGFSQALIQRARPFFSSFKHEIETGLKLMIYKCLGKVFKHFTNVKLLLY